MCKSELPASCGKETCQPAACIPKVCLAPGVTQASLPPDSTFGSVLATDLIPPEQADNVLYVYYWGTAAASFFGGTPGPTPAPLNYLQIYSEDIVYAEAHASGPLVQVVETGGSSMFTTAQDVLNLASQKLFQIAEPALPLWPFPF